MRTPKKKEKRLRYKIILFVWLCEFYAGAKSKGFVPVLEVTKIYETRIRITL